MTCPSDGDSQGGTFCFPATGETVLGNVIQKVFSLSCSEQFKSANITVCMTEDMLGSQKMATGGTEDSKTDFWFRKTFTDIESSLPHCETF